MHLPLTLGLLGLLTAAVLLLRISWWKLSFRLRRLILGVALGLVLLRVVFIGLQWSMSSTHLNALLAWGAIAGYEVLLARFSLMKPRWLTSISAIVLLGPLIGSTLFMPLTRAFDWSRADISSLGGSYIVEKDPWDVDTTGNSGLDLVVFYQPRFVPFLRHLVQRTSFNDDECHSAEAVVKIDPKSRTVHFHCPPRKDGKPPIDVILPLH